MRTYFYQYTPPYLVRKLNGRSVILYMMYFFLYPENLDTIKYSKLTTFFILFVLNPPPSPRTNLVATALYGNLEIDYSINLNKYFWTVINTIAMPLHQTYFLTCFYSYIKFYCPKVRWSWVLWGKKSAISHDKSMILSGICF